MTPLILAAVLAVAGYWTRVEYRVRTRRPAQTSVEVDG